MIVFVTFHTRVIYCWRDVDASLELCISSLVKQIKVQWYVL